MDNASPLCSRCQALSISTLFYRPGPFALGAPDQTWEHEIEALPDIYFNTTCQFCLLVKCTLQAWYGQQFLESKIRENVLIRVVLYGAPFDLNHEDDAPEEDPVPCYLEIGFRTALRSMHDREDRLTNDEFNRAAHLTAMFSVDPMNSTDAKAHIGRVTKPDNIDWDHVKSWISFCSQDAHQNSRQLSIDLADGNRKSYPELRVIDVKTACIVQLPLSAGYVALSYQWGMDQRLKLRMNNKTQLETPGFFEAADCQPSRTIVDAMEVVERLGYRYLWVDALCIIQDSAKDLLLNVNKMDRIYRDAELTIVGAAGNDAEHGLPGVSVSRTEQQIRIAIDGITAANMLEPAAGAITFSRWNTRGWTYQERILSRKLLTFTNSQVFYHCNRNCNFQEQFIFRSDSDHFAPFDPRASLDFERRNIWENYALAVAEYTKRSLSDPNDKLRAFSGLTNFLEGPLHAPFFFGLPVSLFDVALLWVFAEPCDRGLLTFPSWSWAGWNGAVRYAYASSMNNICECTISQASISTDSGAVILCTDITTADEAPSACYDRQRWQRDFDADTLEILYTSKSSVHQGIIYPRPMPLFDDVSRAGLLEEVTPILRIAGKTAVFRLTGQHSPQRNSLSRNAANCKQGHHELCHLAILDDHERWAGTVLINGRLLPELKNRKHKFVALSRSTLYRIDLDPSWDTESATFRHWTGQRNEQRKDGSDDEEPNTDFFDRQHFDANVWWPAMNVLLLSEPKDGIVERMGVGRIHFDAFDVVAKREDIILG